MFAKHQTYCRLGKGVIPNKSFSSSVSMPMKKLFLALAVIGSVVGTSLTAIADDDHRDHDGIIDDDHRNRDWNDEYWHHEHYGYWHGERGYWRYHHHKHEFIQVGPVTIEKGH